MIFLSTPSARRATGQTSGNTETGLFLSTPSARRATQVADRDLPQAVIFLSTPSARRATRVVGGEIAVTQISIHALREEGDHWKVGTTVTTTRFLSTPSARRATHPAVIVEVLIVDFYPRPPRGGRPIMAVSRICDILFLSTPSARRATSRRLFGGEVVHISIHALREEGDLC